MLGIATMGNQTMVGFSIKSEIFSLSLAPLLGT